MTYMIFGFCNIFINGKCIHFWVTIAFNLNTIPCIHGNGFSLHLHSIWCQYYISLLHDNLSKRSSVKPTENYLWISQDQSWLTTYRRLPLNITGSLTNHDWQPTEDNLWISQGAWPIMTDNLQKITSEYHREPHQSWLTIYRKFPLNITGSLTNHNWHVRSNMEILPSNRNHGISCYWSLDWEKRVNLRYLKNINQKI